MDYNKFEIAYTYKCQSFNIKLNSLNRTMVPAIKTSKINF